MEAYTLTGCDIRVFAHISDIDYPPLFLSDTKREGENNQTSGSDKSRKFFASILSVEIFMFQMKGIIWNTSSACNYWKM